MFIDHRALAVDLAATGLAGADDAAVAREARGFALDTDVDRTVLAGFASPEAAPPSTLEIHDGRFDDATLRGSHLARAGACAPFRDVEILGAPPQALVRLGEARVAIGPERLLRDALDRRAGRSPAVTGAPWFEDALATLDELWGDPTVPRPRTAVELAVEITAGTGPRLDPYLAGAATLRWLGLRAGGDGKGLRVVLAAAARSSAAAGNLAGHWRSAAEGVAARPQWRLLGVAQVLSRAHIETRGHLVVATVAVGPASWRDLRQRLGEVADYLRRAEEKDSN